ncbi:hypothetical protein BJF79_18600 [Actinomadura sp. CNU-125]|uniref:DUF4132 domain-containing protein n=1 Tax=Actinomadura sp. CNU-125 TaxID=1904961 RepID=UPI0009692552|nr:DUF4132 domain-containing protein [Actinomadura sp. CNU-125]OLT16066.1 hypothetical protein BJF79_18600 [Actinomadura sp. CNU-125]
MTKTPRLPDAPASALPPLLVDPPWTRPVPTAAPVVLKLKASKEPTIVRWAPGVREEWLKGTYDLKYGGVEPLPDDTDWDALAETFASGEALKKSERETRGAFTALVLQAPPEYGEKLLADERYWDVYRAYGTHHLYQAAAARHELAAYGFVLHRAKSDRLIYGIEPYLDAKVAQLMVKHFGVYPNADRAEAWYRLHGADAARLTVPSALRKPGPTRDRAEQALRLVAQVHGHGTVVEAARHHGDEAAAAISALRTDPLDLYPDPLPNVPAELAPERLPQVLLRGREHALPASATRHFITLLAIAHVQPSYPGVQPVVDALDPGSLAEFARELFVADRSPKSWASPAVQYALLRFGDDGAADLIAPIAKRWDNWDTWNRGGTNVLSLFTRLGTPTALRHLHMLAEKAADQKRLRPFAKSALQRIADERGYTTEQLADRLVPPLGLDAEGTMTLDYGRRSFRVGFDEHLKPFVTDEEGKTRKTLPKPGVKDDPELAPASYQRFGTLKKEVRAVATDQMKRLERAMVAGRSWTPDEFRTIFAEHPLLRHVVRRLVWSADSTAFRVAEDGTFADVHDDAFVLPDDARVTLPHPIRLDLAPWTEVFADYEILQPFEQLARPVHTLTDAERTATELTRFSGKAVHFGRITGMTSRGWELGDKEDGGFRRQVMHMTGDGRHVMVFFSPGIRVYSPEELPDQEIRDVFVLPGRYSGKPIPLGDLDPAVASELINDLTRLTA